MHHFLLTLKDLYSQSKRRNIYEPPGCKERERKQICKFCRLCKTENETIHHIIVCYPKLSASMHLPVRHDKVVKVIYDAIIDHDRTPIEEIYTNSDRPSQTACTVTILHITYTQTAFHVHENSCTVLVPLCKNNLNLPTPHTDHYTV